MKPEKKSKWRPPLDLFSQDASLFIGGEDNFVTTPGFICSIIYILIMLGAFIYYMYIYIKKEEVIISQAKFTSTETPSYDLGAGGFNVSLIFRNNDREIDPAKLTREYMKVSAYHVTVSGSDNNSTDTEPTIKRLKLPVINCEGMTVGKKALKNTRGEKTGFMGNAECIQFNEGTVISGEVGDSVWKYVEIRFEPCDNDQVECATKNLANGGNVHSAEDYKKAYNFFRKFVTKLNYVNADGDLENYDDPILNDINTQTELRINLRAQKFRDFYIRKYEVETTYGYFWEQTSSVDGLNVESTFFEFVERDPTTNQNFNGPSGTEQRVDPYYTIRILASNKQLKISRDYELLTDALGNVGGIAEIASLFLLAFICMDRDVRFERFMLNEALLESEIAGPSERGYYIYNPQTGSYTRRRFKQKFSYWEIFKFKYIPCVREKGEGELEGRRMTRFEEYEKDMELLQSRLDVTSVIQNNGRMQVLENTIFEDYQLKLVPHLKPNQDEERERLAGMSSEEAMYLLDAPEVYRTEEQTRIDNYIKENLDANFVDDFMVAGRSRTGGVAEERQTKSPGGFGFRRREFFDKKGNLGNGQNRRKKYLNRYSDASLYPEPSFSPPLPFKSSGSIAGNHYGFDRRYAGIELTSQPFRAVNSISRGADLSLNTSQINSGTLGSDTSLVMKTHPSELSNPYLGGNTVSQDGGRQNGAREAEAGVGLRVQGLNLRGKGGSGGKGIIRNRNGGRYNNRRLVAIPYDNFKGNFMTSDLRNQHIYYEDSGRDGPHR